MKKIALITGATSGIGKAVALKLAEENYNLIITGRRQKRLDALQSFLEETYKVRIHKSCFDVRDRNSVKEKILKLPADIQHIDLLVNNAGLAVGLKTFQSGHIENWETIIDTNIKGLLYVSKIVAGRMINRGKGQIINVGSSAGKQVYAKTGVYCATKHAAEALTQSLRIELAPYAIKVGLVSPGTVKTEFSFVKLKDVKKAEAVYREFQPLQAKDIAETVAFMASRPSHVNINDIFIMPSQRADAFHIYPNIQKS